MRFFLSGAAVVVAVITGASGAARAQSHVACVGDSITFGEGASSSATAYPAVLQGLLGGAHAVQNDGHSGATMLKSGDIPYWTTAKFAASTAWAAAGGDVVIQLGTNDSKPKNWMNKASFVADCEAMIDHYRAASPSTRVWISLIPPATAGACCRISGTTIANEIIPFLQQCAANKNATTIDVHAALALHPDWLPDGVHPNDQGAALIAQTVYGALANVPSIGLSASAPSSAAPAAVELTATPLAAYGKVEKVRFFRGATLLGERASAPWTFTAANLAAGMHSFTAVVVETAGRTQTSAQVDVDVDAAAPPPPIEDASTGDAAADASASGSGGTTADGGSGASSSGASSGTSTSGSSGASGTSGTTSSASSSGSSSATPSGNGEATPAKDDAGGCSSSASPHGSGGPFVAALCGLVALALRARRRR